MLNEWVEIHPVLKQLGCDLGESHPSFKPCPAKANKKSFVISLDKNGHVEDVNIPDFDVGSVYRWNESKHAPAFPAFNVRAFWEVTCDPSLIPAWIAEALKDKSTRGTESRRPNGLGKDGKEKSPVDDAEFQDFLRGCGELWDVDLAWIGRCLKDLPNELLNILETTEEQPPGYQAYRCLVERANLCQPANLRDEVRAKLIQKLRDTKRKEYAEALFALKKDGKKKGRGREHGKDFVYLLTINDWDRPEYGENAYPPYPYLNSPLQHWMARAFEQYCERNYESIGDRDAFGHDMAGATEKYDDIDTKGIGQIKLFAANEDIPCLERYGLQGCGLFPAGRTARELARKSLGYVLAKERKGITWTSLKKYETRNTVAFAYCTKLKDASVIGVFDNDDEGAQEDVYITEESTKAVLKTLEGIAEAEPSSEVVVGIMTAVDKGNTKVLASRHYPVAHYISGAKRWQAGCANIPDVEMPWLELRSVKQQKGTTPRKINNSLPVYPARAVWLLNTSWRQNGEMITRKQGSQKVPISKHFTSSDAIDFLFENDEALCVRIDVGLESLVEKSALTLIKARLKAVLDQNKRGDKLDFKDSEYLHMLPTLYGLLLHKKGIEKEGYMQEEVFCLGRLFAAVDRLHIYYSQSERDGDIPARLLGNDHMVLALQNPQEAFVALGRRMMHPYVSWAKRYELEQDADSERVGSCLMSMANLCQRLSEEDLPTEIDDADKAKLVLGYLSYEAQKKPSAVDGTEHKK